MKGYIINVTQYMKWMNSLSGNMSTQLNGLYRQKNKFSKITWKKKNLVNLRKNKLISEFISSPGPTFKDSTFLTSHPNDLDFKIKNSYYMPNPSDFSFETLKNYENNCEKDLFL